MQVLGIVVLVWMGMRAITSCKRINRFTEIGGTEYFLEKSKKWGELQERMVIQFGSEQAHSSAVIIVQLFVLATDAAVVYYIGHTVFTQLFIK